MVPNNEGFGLSEAKSDSSLEENQGGRRSTFRWLAVGISAVLVLGVATWLILDNRTETAPSSIEDSFEIDNASLFLLDEGYPVKRVQLSDGKYLPPDATEGDPYLHAVSKPEFADLDGDGDLDAAAVVEFTDKLKESYGGWRAIYFWLWDEGKVKAVRWPAAWQWNCVAAEQENGSDLAIQNAASPFGLLIDRNTNNLCSNDILDDSARTDSSYFVAIKDGFPVVTAGQKLALATESCTGGDSQDPVSGVKYVDVSERLSMQPLVQPSDDAPEVDGPRPPEKLPSDGSDEKPKIVFKADRDFVPSKAYLKVHQGYVPLVVSWGFDYQGCGWVKWKDLNASLNE